MQERANTISLAVILAAIVIAQSSNLLTLFGVKLNLIIVTLAVLSLFIESAQSYFLILVVTASLSSVNSWFSKELIAILAVGSLLFFLKKRFFSPGLVVNAIVIAIATIALYLILSPSFILSSAFAIELSLNEFVGLIIFMSFAKLTGLNYRKITWTGT